MKRLLIAMRAGSALLAVACAAGAEEQDTRVVTRVSPKSSSCSAVFGGEKTRRQYRVVDPGGEASRLAWSLVAEGRVLSRGELGLDQRAKDVQSVDIEVAFPKVREGVVLDTTLTVKLLDANRKRVLAQDQRKVYVFGRNPFAQQKHWLKSLDIRLYDPLGDTAAALSAQKVPFKRVRSADALAGVRQGLVVLGEGISAKTLVPAVSDLVKHGVDVLWLAPKSGQLPIVGLGVDHGLPRPDRLVFRDLDVLGDLDDRLAADAWPSEGTVIRCRLGVRSRQGLCITSDEDQAGWPWLECRYRQPRATLVVCGLAIIETWDSGPAPRFCFARMLTYVSKHKPIDK